MVDEAVRNAERAYRRTGDPGDGEAWVQAVLRTTGLNSTFLIARVIEAQRMCHALMECLSGGDTMAAQRRALRSVTRPVTPDDMVSFLRGGREWLAPPPTVQVVTSYTPTSIDVMPDGGLSMRGRGTIEEQERPAIHPAQAVPTLIDGMREDVDRMARIIVGDPNAHLPHRRGVPAGSAILCNHANENPGHCPCGIDCYCRQDGNTCSDVRSEPNPFDRQCDYCSNEATWRFRYTTVVPNGHRNGRRVEVVCGSHLVQAREESATFNYDFMNRQATEQRVAMLRDSHRHMDSLDEMVRHHEAVDGDVRHCANGPCGKALPMNHLAIYCSARCALNDA